MVKLAWRQLKQPFQESISRYDLIPFAPYCLFLSAVLSSQYYLNFAFAGSMSGIALVVICYELRTQVKEEREESSDSTQNTSQKASKPKDSASKDGVKKHGDVRNGDHERNNFFVLFYAIYVIIAGLSFTNGIEKFVGTSIFTNTNSFSDLPTFLVDPSTSLLVSFLALTILFYNCGLLFLSKEGFRYLTAGTGVKRKKEILFFNVIILFAEAIILYFIGDSVTTPQHFVLWVAVLMSVDILWTIIQRFAFLRKEKGWEAKVPFEWIHLDALVFVFLWFMLDSLQTSSQSSLPELLLLLMIVLCSRTVADYWAMWNRVWNKFPVPSS